MAALRPIVRDPLEGPATTLEDRYRVVQRERPRAVADSPVISNPLSAPMAGYRSPSPGRIRGGSFAPRATSGML
jgi:hypothetical protein